MVLTLCFSFFSLPYSLNVSDGKSHSLLASKRIWHLFWALKMGLVLISNSVHGNLHLALRSFFWVGSHTPSVYVLICVWKKRHTGTDTATDRQSKPKCVCVCVCACAFWQPRVNRKDINPPFCSPCPCVVVIFNNTVSIQQLIQLTRIQIINEHAFSPFWREAVSSLTMRLESALGLQLKVCETRQ